MEYNIPYLCKNSKSFLINEIFIGMIILKYQPFTPQGDFIEPRISSLSLCELHPKSWTQNFWGALCIESTHSKKG